MLKEFIHTTLGASVVIKQKVEAELKELESKGKIKKSDAKAFLKAIEKKGKAEDKRVKKEMRRMVKEIINELGIATKKDLKKLKEELQDS